MDLDEKQTRDWLGNATARHVYYFGETRNADGTIAWGTHPACACGIVGEQHVSQLARDEKSPLQAAFEYSDGMGNVVVKKIQAEPDPKLPEVEQKLRWIANGKTILNNKGKPVKQYEPYFSPPEIGHRFEEPRAEGVTPILYYDAAGRVIRTEMPDGTFSRVEFSPWHVKTFDANDNLKESRWYAERLTAVERGVPLYAPNDTIEQKQEKDKAEEKAVNAKPEAKRAAHLAANHANTPALTLLDSLGREVIAIAHNRTPDAGGNWQDDYYTTFTKLDAEGKPLWIRDARGNLVMQYITPARPNNATGEDMPANTAPCYDIAGNLLFQHSMDAGDRWMLMDAAGKPMLAWDEYKPKDDEAVVEKRFYATDYDQLHRPTAQWLAIDAKPRVKLERYEYQDAVLNDANNLNGQLIKHFDSSGLLETVRRDFKGNVEKVQRTLNNKPKESFIDWNTDDPATHLEEKETFIQITEYDALNRMAKLFNWHRTGKPVAVYIPVYGKRGVLTSERLIVGANKDNSPEGYRGGTENDAIQDIRYDAKGQRQYLKLGKGIITHYDYDPETFRLKQLRTTRPTYDPLFPDYHAELKDPNVLQQLHYTYDPVGNITEIHDEAYKTAYFQNAIIEPKNRYKYDALYRLIEATGREDGAISGAPDDFEAKIRETSFPITDANALRKYTQTYQYDSVGNIKQMHHSAGMGTWTRTNAYATDSNRLIKTTHRNQSTDIRYDSHGSMLNLANVADEFLMQWDHRDMIASIKLGGGSFAYYQYDANKQRTRKYIEKNNGNIVEERIYLGGLEIFRQWVNGDLKQEIETLHLFDGEQRLLMVDQIDDVDSKSTLYRYTLSNHLGSSTLELDEQAKLISYEEYHPYGTSAYRAGRNAAEVKLKRYRYTGMERDEESGLNYHSARYLSCQLALWFSCDEMPRDIARSRYASVAGNPLRMTDRNGLQEEEKKGFKYWLGELLVPGSQDMARKADKQDRVFLKAIEDHYAKGNTGPESEAQLQALLDRRMYAIKANLLPILAMGMYEFNQQMERAQDKMMRPVVREPLMSGSTQAEIEMGLVQSRMAKQPNLNAGVKLPPVKVLLAGTPVPQAGTVALEQKLLTAGTIAPEQKLLPAGNPTTQVNTAAPMKLPTLIEVAEQPLPNPIRKRDVLDEWNKFLGPNQTDIHPRTGLPHVDRVVSQDGTRSIRFGEHEMNNKRSHFHFENWTYDPDPDFPTIMITNDVQNINK